jgi:hypothetical protein
MHCFQKVSILIVKMFLFYLFSFSRTMMLLRYSYSFFQVGKIYFTYANLSETQKGQTPSEGDPDWTRHQHDMKACIPLSATGRFMDEGLGQKLVEYSGKDHNDIIFGCAWKLNQTFGH